MSADTSVVPQWGKAAGPWRDVPASDWNDWRWQLKNLVRTPERLAELLGLPNGEADAVRGLQKQFRFSVSPYYFSLIDVHDPHDPIRRMIVPSSLEDTAEGDRDPLAEKDDQVAPGLTHRYPDRVLLVVTSFCSSYCRFCIRKRNWKHSDAASSKAEIDQAIEYLRAHEEVRDVLISGGDPLTLPVDHIDYILTQLRTVPHIEFIRVGSREPVMLPMRFNDDLLRMLDKHSAAGPLWINTHFNHPREITEEAAKGCERLARLGIPLGNQTVLLAGVNDDVAIMKKLFTGLLRIRVRPYYLYQADPVVGANHLRTSVWKGIEIMEALRGHITGLAVPTFVVDAPGGGGKIPMMPNYMVSASPGRVVLRNFEGAMFSYPDGGQAPPAPPPAQPARINGNGHPSPYPGMNGNGNGYTNGNGSSNGNGHAGDAGGQAGNGRGLPVGGASDGNANGNGNGHGYSNGNGHVNAEPTLNPPILTPLNVGDDEATEYLPTSVADLASGRSRRMIPRGHPHYERREQVAEARKVGAIGEPGVETMPPVPKPQPIPSTAATDATAGACCGSGEGEAQSNRLVSVGVQVRRNPE